MNASPDFGAQGSSLSLCNACICSCLAALGLSVQQHLLQSANHPVRPLLIIDTYRNLWLEVHVLSCLHIKTLMLSIHPVRPLLSDISRQITCTPILARAKKDPDMHACRLLCGPGPASEQQAAAAGSKKRLMFAVKSCQVVIEQHACSEQASS